MKSFRVTFIAVVGMLSFAAVAGANTKYNAKYNASGAKSQKAAFFGGSGRTSHTSSRSSIANMRSTRNSHVTSNGASHSYGKTSHGRVTQSARSSSSRSSGRSSNVRNAVGF